MKTTFRRAIASVLAVTGVGALACSPSFPSPFLSGADKTVGSSSLAYELAILGNHFWKDLAKKKFPRKSPKVADADLEEFAVFLDTVKPTLSETLKTRLRTDYESYAKLCRKGQVAVFPVKVPGADEFILYLEGVVALKSAAKRGETMVEIPKQWKAILALPKEKRLHRTTWVLYMAGNMTKDPAKAKKHYDALRKAVADGYTDSLALAHASYRAATFCNDMVWRLKNHFEAYCYYTVTKDTDRAGFSHDWIRELLRRHAFTYDLAKAWVEDEVCRELITIFSTTSQGQGYRHPVYMGPNGGTRIPFDILNVLKGKTLRSAGHAAWFAYERGRWAEAAKFAAMAEKDDLIGLWIKSRLARRSGETKKAVAFLREWLTVYKIKRDKKNMEASSSRLRFGVWYDGRGFHQHVRGQLGVIKVGMEDFTEALHCFMLGDSWVDAASIADRIMDLKALTTYVDAQQKAKSAVTSSESWPKLRWLLARRLFRIGQVNTALAYYPKDVLPAAKAYQKQAVAAEKATTKDDKAIALYCAAKLLRWKGMELAGTELEPDVTWQSGQFPYSGQKENWPARFGDTSVPKRHKNTTVSPNKRYHYRYLAADKMWEAAQLAASAEIKAIALYMGGRFIELRDPKAADRFYKALVNVEAFPLSQKADSLRWFPKNYSKAMEAEFKSIVPVTAKDLKGLMNVMQILHEVAYDQGTIRAVAFTRDSGSLLVLSNNGDLMVFNPMNGKKTRTIAIPPRYRDRLVASPKTDLAIVGGKQGSIQVVDLAKGNLVKTVKISAKGIRALAWSEDGKVLAIASADGVVDLRRTTDWTSVGRLTVENVPRTLAFSSDGKTLACGSSKGNVELWAVGDQNLTKTLKGHRSDVRSLVFSPDGSRLYSGSDDYTLRAWDAVTGRFIHELSGHYGGIVGALPNAKGDRVLTLSMDGHMRSWDVETGKPKLKRTISQTSIMLAAKSRDGRWAVATDRRGTIRIICYPFAE